MKVRGRTARGLVVAGIAACAVTSISYLAAQEILGGTGVRGAGSTFVYPVLSRWFHEYVDQRARDAFAAPNSGLDGPASDTALSYEPVGSLGGMLRVKDRAVDFAASDVPLESRELAAFGLAQFPIVLGGIVVAVNVEGIPPGAMRLTGPVLADIYLGKIPRWSDRAIQALNPTIGLPDAPIAVVYRSDGSGTTFNFTDYLGKVSAEWKTRVGSGMLVRWPAGTGAKGNEGLAEAVRRVGNSIGYVEYAQALQSKLGYAALQNRAGRFVQPGTAAFQAAAAGATWRRADDFHVMLTDPPGEDAYPIAATVFVFMHRSASRARTRATLDFFQWSLEKGAASAAQLGYVPLPAGLVAEVKDYWTRTLKPGGGG
jgi:phosphate transport system substrate-binding protein